MPSEFLGLEIGKRGLTANQTALNVVSHNLANASNKDYSRQMVELGTVSPLYAPQYNREYMRGQIGQGVQIASIMRVRDAFVDGRIMEEKSVQAFFQTQHKYLTQVQQIFSEPGQSTLQQKFEDFVNSWNDVSLNASSGAPRAALASSAQGMVDMLQTHYRNLQDMRQHVNALIQDKVTEINSLSSQIRDLNKEILKVKALRDQPNDLMDKRDALIEKLSTITNIRVVERDPDEIFVYIGGKTIIQGEKFNALKAVPDGSRDGMFDIKFDADDSDVAMTEGELAGLIDIRDQKIGMAMQKLNNFAINLAKTVNDHHRQGFGLTRTTGMDFFTLDHLITNTQGNFDSNGDGVLDSTRIYSVNGTKSLKLDDTINEGGVLNLGQDNTGKDVLITYRATDTVRDIIGKINESPARLSASLNDKGHLVLKSLYTENEKESFYIRHLEDSGQFLGSFSGILNTNGMDGAFDSGTPDSAAQLLTSDYEVSFAKNAAANLSVNSSILQDPENIAVRGGKDTTGDGFLDTPNGGADGSLGLKIVASLTATLDAQSIDDNTQIDQNAVMLDKGNASFRPFLSSMIAKIGEDAKSAKSNLDKEDTILTGLINLRQNISGVNADEELVQLIKYQHGYQGAAKVVQTLNTMLDVIINLGR